MARRIVVDCDNCGKQCVEPVEICLHVDREMGPAGSMENEYRNYDLCASCCAKFVRALKNRMQLSFEDAQYLSELIKNGGLK